MMDGQPDFTLRVKNASQVTPRHCKVRPRFDGLQITCLNTPKKNMLKIQLRCTLLRDECLKRVLRQSHVITPPAGMMPGHRASDGYPNSNPASERYYAKCTLGTRHYANCHASVGNVSERRWQHSKLNAIRRSASESLALPTR